jgi:hypothetical protein
VIHLRRTCAFSSAVVPRCDRGMNDAERSDEESHCYAEILHRFALQNDIFQEPSLLSSKPVVSAVSDMRAPVESIAPAHLSPPARPSLPV